MWLLNHFLFSNYHNGLCIDTFIFNKSLFGLVIAKTMTMLWIYIEIKLDESSMKLGNKSF
jgi:hypothetical protein